MNMSNHDTGAEKEAFVEGLFTRIAPGYDLMNLLMTGGLWRVWQRVFRRHAGIGAGDRVLDIGCGTAELSLLMAHLGAQVVGVDLSAGMLAVGRRKVDQAGMQERITLVQGNALHLPFDAAEFDAVTSAFMLRNVADVDAALAEMVRVLRPGGRAAVLELSHPPSRLVSLPFWAYFSVVPPLLGAWDHQAYSWLPRSLATFPGAEALAERFEAVGFADVRYRRLSGGIVCLHTARKAA